MITRNHYIDVYDTQVHLVTTRREWTHLRKELTQLPKSEALEELFGRVDRVVKKTSVGYRQIHIVIFINIPEHYGDQMLLLDTVSHESYHAAGLIFEAIGARFKARDEPMAHLVGWFTRWVWETLCSP